MAEDLEESVLAHLTSVSTFTMRMLRIIRNLDSLNVWCLSGGVDISILAVLFVHAGQDFVESVEVNTPALGNSMSSVGWT